MNNTLTLVKRNVWIIYFLLALAGTCWVWFGMPHDGHIVLYQLAVKIATFLLLISTIAFFPNKNKLVYTLVIGSFLIPLVYILPRLSYLGYIGIPSDPIGQGNEFYTHLYLLLYPFIIMLACFSYRIGGGKPGNCYKIALCGVLLIFSGLLDIMWYIVNPVDIPEVIPYAQHLQIFFGRPAGYTETIVFALCHLPFIIGVLFVPVDRWIEKIFPGLYEEK